jgi:hypothetical protein
MEDITPLKSKSKSKSKQIKPNKLITKSRNIYFEEGEEISIYLCNPDALPTRIDSNNIYINNLLNKRVNINHSNYNIKLEQGSISISCNDVINYDIEKN